MIVALALLARLLPCGAASASTCATPTRRLAPRVSPTLMERFEVPGRLELREDLKSAKPCAPKPDQAPELRAREIPLEETVVRFAGSAPRP